MQTAVTASEAVQSARAGINRADGEKVRARSFWFPSAAASGSYDRTLKSEFDAFRMTEAAAPGGATDLSELPFGQRNTHRFGVAASQRLLEGGLIARVHLAQANRRSAAMTLDEARAQAVMDAAQAYFEVVLTERLVRIAESSLQQAERVLEVTRSGRVAGAQSEFELLRAGVAAANQRPPLVRRRVDHQIAGLQLRQLLDVRGDRPLVLVTPLQGDLQGLDNKAREAAGVSADPGNTHSLLPVQRAQAEVAAAEAALSVVRGQWVPSLAVGMEYGRVAYPSEVFPSWDEFRTNWVVGLTLRWSFFTGGRILGEVQIASADLQNARANLQQLRELADLQTRTARADLDAALAAWTATAGTVEQAQRAYELSELRYKEGVGTQVEVFDARLQLQDAEISRSLAARDLQLARIRLALIPNLPLPIEVAGRPVGLWTAAGPRSTLGTGGGAALLAPYIPPVIVAPGSPAGAVPSGATVLPGAGGVPAGREHSDRALRRTRTGGHSVCGPASRRYAATPRRLLCSCPPATLADTRCPRPLVPAHLIDRLTAEAAVRIGAIQGHTQGSGVVHTAIALGVVPAPDSHLVQPAVGAFPGEVLALRIQRVVQEHVDGHVGGRGPRPGKAQTRQTDVPGTCPIDRADRGGVILLRPRSGVRDREQRNCQGARQPIEASHAWSPCG